MCSMWIRSFKACWWQNLLFCFNVIYGPACLCLSAPLNFLKDLWTILCNCSLPVFYVIIDMWRLIFCNWIPNFWAYSRWIVILYFYAIYDLAVFYLWFLSNLLNGLLNYLCNLSLSVFTILMSMRWFMCSMWIGSFKACWWKNLLFCFNFIYEPTCLYLSALSTFLKDLWTILCNCS